MNLLMTQKHICRPRAQVFSCQEGVGWGAWTGNLGLADANYYIVSQ